MKGGKKSVAPQFRGASVVFLAVMVLQNKCFIKITVCVCVCVCVLLIFGVTHTRESLSWSSWSVFLTGNGFQVWNGQSDVFWFIFSSFLKHYMSSHYTRGSSANTARTCGKYSLRALPPLRSPCSSIGRSSLYMFTEFYVRFFFFFFPSESRRGCEARAPTPCGCLFSH